MELNEILKVGDRVYSILHGTDKDCPEYYDLNNE